MRHTPEQEAIIESKSPFLRVNAFAGTGKTTTLASYALARPDADITYVAFSKSVQNKASEIFPKNVKCITSHGLAYPKYGRFYDDAGKIVKKLKVNEVVNALGLNEYPEQYRYYIADACLKSLNRYLATTERDITTDLTHGFVLPEAGIDASTICDITNTLWSRMKNPKDLEIGMLHDGYLKLYQLSNPVLPCDVLLFDEAQDANPVTAAIVERQNCLKVVVGDTHQSIFGFRLAVNAMNRFNADQSLYLTQSFRFGQEIADLANYILLNYKDEERKIKGAAIPSQVGPLPAKAATAIIARANATLFAEAVTATEAGKRLYFVGNDSKYRLQDTLDAYSLWRGDRASIASPYLKAFKSFGSIERFSETTDDKELKSLIGIVRRHGNRIPDLVKRISLMTVQEPGKAHVHLTTAHGAKGLEWSNVKLANDYMDLLDAYGRPRKINLWKEEEEANILYVATTRAKKMLQPFTELQQLWDAQKQQ